MAPPVASAKLTLSCPLYAVDFDPKNNGFLLVGGGGGEGRSGVGNKIALIDTSRKHEIKEIVDVELSRDEDSVTSLAVAQSSKDSARVLAGINSSSAEQQTGRNEHLRTFRLGYPPKRKRDGDAVEAGGEETAKSTSETTALGRVSLFTPSSASKKETYQRVLRLSPAEQESGTRLGAISTGLAPAGEIVVFNAMESSPKNADVQARVQLKEGEEAVDMDLVSHEDGTYRLAYCTNYEVYLHDVPSPPFQAPRFLHGTPHPDVFSSGKARPAFRCLRFLTPTLLLFVQNQLARSGVEVLLLEIALSGTSGALILRKRLSRSIKSATALATTTLTSPKPTQNIQHAIAIAGHDLSITILTLDHHPSNNSSLTFRTHSTLRNTHPVQITALAFSSFNPPPNPSTASPQYLKLASVSFGATLTVHTFPLTPSPPPSRGQKSPSRYLLRAPSEASQTSFSVLVSILVVAIGAFLLQAFTEIRGGTPEYLGVKGWLSERVHNYIAQPYMFENRSMDLSSLSSHVEAKATEATTLAQAVSSLASEASENMHSALPTLNDIFSLRTLLSRRALPSTHLDGLPSSHAIHVRADGAEVSANLHTPEAIEEEEGRRWEELLEDEKEAWRKRLVEAGEWSVGEGESVLKGVFFSSVAGAVGGAVRGM